MKTRTFWSTMIALAGGLALGGCGGQSDAPWWNRSWHYRTKLDVEVRYWARHNQPYDVVVDFPALLKAAGIQSAIDADSPRVVRYAGGVSRVLPIAIGEIHNPRENAAESAVTFPVTERGYEVGDYYLYFDTAANGSKRRSPKYDVLANLVPNWHFGAGADNLPAGWQSSHPEFFRRGQFAKTAGGAGCLEFFIDESNVKYFTDPDEPNREWIRRHGLVTVSRWIDVESYSGQEMLFQIKFLLTHGPWGQPVQVRLRQFRGERELRHYAVDPRWLTITLAEGQAVHFSEYGRIARGANRLRLEVVLRGGVTTFPYWMPSTGPLDVTPIRGPDYYTTLCVGDIVLRPAGRVSFPGKTYGEFVPGRWGGSNDRAFDFVGCRHLGFGVWPFGERGEDHRFPDRTEPEMLHWPMNRAQATDDLKIRGPSRGTLEFDFKPHWDSSDNLPRNILFGPTGWETGSGTPPRMLSLARSRGVHLGCKTAERGSTLFFRYVDWEQRTHIVSAKVGLKRNRWYSVAVTWDSTEGEMALFVDGRRVGRAKDEPFDWYLPDVGPICFGGGERRTSTRSHLDASLDNVRISDVVRHTRSYAPPRGPLRVDSHTTALFPFDGLREGVHHGDDEHVAVSAVVEAPPLRQDVTLEEVRRGKVSLRSVVFNRVAPELFDEFLARFPDHREFAMAKQTPESATFQKKKLAAVLEPGTDTYTVQVDGDHGPVNVSVSIEPLGGTLTNPRTIDTALPDPFDLATIGRDLRKQAGSDEDAAIRLFHYYIWRNCHFAGLGGGIKPEKHQPMPDYVPYNPVNVAPCIECGPRNQALSVLFLRAGLSSMYPRDQCHGVGQEVFYDGAWHCYDHPARPTLTRDNRRIASVREIYTDPYMCLRCTGGFGWHGLMGSIELPRKVRGTIPFFEIPTGARYVRLWQPLDEKEDPRKPVGTVAHGIIEIDSNLADGKLLSWAEEATNLQVVKRGDRAHAVRQEKSAPARILLRMRAAFPFTSAQLTLGELAHVSFSLSEDAGRTWVAVNAKANATVAIPVAEVHEYLLRMSFTSAQSKLGDFRLRNVFYCNPRSINADLKLGRNEMRLIYCGKRTTPVKVTHEYYEVHNGG